MSADFDGNFTCDEGSEVTCVECGGYCVRMGTLGPLDWFRCRACGLNQSFGDVSDVAKVEAAQPRRSGRPRWLQSQQRRTR